MKASGFKLHMRIWFLTLKNSLGARMAYPANFFIMAMGVVIIMSLNIFFVKVIYSFVSNIAGWNYYEALLVVASYMIIEGMMWGTCAYLAVLQRTVRLGGLDTIIVKPKDTQFLITVWRGDPEDWMRVVTALFVLYQAVSGLELGYRALVVNLPFYALMILSAYIIIYSITLMVRSIVFWVIDSSAMWAVTENITSASKYPTDIFKGKFIKALFSSVIPLSFMATVPAKILIGGPKTYLVIFSILVAVIFFVSSRKFFLFALKRYSSVSG